MDDSTLIVVKLAAFHVFQFDDQYENSLAKMIDDPALLVAI